MSQEALDLLEGKAASIDAQRIQQDDVTAETVDTGPQQPDNLGVIVFMLTGLREVSVAVLKVSSPRLTLADDKVHTIAGVLAPVADKYGLQLGQSLAAYGPELAALMTAGPLLWTAYRELDKELATRRAKQDEKQEVQQEVVADGG